MLFKKCIGAQKQHQMIKKDSAKQLNCPSFTDIILKTLAVATINTRFFLS